VNKAGAIFDIDKLNWMNGMYLRHLPIERLADDAIPALEAAGFTEIDRPYVEAVINLLKERINFITDIPTFGDYMFGPIGSFDEEYAAKHWKPETAGQMIELANRLAALEAVEWTVERIEAVVRGFAEELGFSAGKLIHPMRLAITGKRVGAGMFETMVVLGQKKSVERLMARSASSQ
jgi:glutamyl-tRNA synthetase